MPIKIPDELPAVNFLRNENIFVMTSSKAKIQEIRPLKILVLNLMPKKIETENQLLRLLSNSPLQIDIQFLRIDGYQSKNTSAKHLNSFYCNFEDIKKYNFDGLIVTGAPFGKMNFNQISCWKQITNIFIWLKTHVTSTLFICWAAQAALNIIYDIPKKIRKTKLSGVYKHHILHPNALLTKGFDDIFLAPHSRYADFSFDFITNHTNLEIFASSKKTGIYLMASKDKRFVFVTGHPEYDAITLANEYYRDYSVGLKPKIPYNYFPKNDKNLQPSASWRSHGNLLFLNWLNYYIYQITPYDLNSF